MDNAEKVAIVSKLLSENIAHLYHFTSINNLDGIRDQGGLCSKQQMLSTGNWPSDPGGNSLSQSLDRQNANFDLISFNLTPHTPMAYNTKQNKHLCFIYADLRVAAEEGVVFTDANATKNDHNRGVGLKGLDLVKFEFVTSQPCPWDQNWLKYSQAEVLVPRSVSINSIDQITFVSPASMQEAEKIWGKSDHPRFVVDTSPFANLPSAADQVGFSHIKEVILTYDEIDGTNCQKIHKDEDHIWKNAPPPTLLVRLWATAGTKGKMELLNRGTLVETDFKSTNSWSWWHKLSASFMPYDYDEVVISLNGIRWVSRVFRVI